VSLTSWHIPRLFILEKYNIHNSRLRRLQHLLVDLILHLNGHGSGSSPKQLKTDAAPHCICDGCPGTAAVFQIVSPTTKLPEP
jgi:hypothetical protein